MRKRKKIIGKKSSETKRQDFSPIMTHSTQYRFIEQTLEEYFDNRFPLSFVCVCACVLPPT